MAYVQLTSNASARGKTIYAKGSTRPVYAFLGIPFACPPVGELRFKPPLASQLWNGEKDCTEYGAMCSQHIVRTRSRYLPFKVQDNMSEDCLFLNIWTSNPDPNARLPVMVWIHGGAWLRGSGDVNPGTALASFHDVVYVSINYRLGIFGFMSTGDDVCPGNLGLLDQVEALRWVQKYIKQFGGDPENVTIFGESAGSMSCFLHMVSHLSRGLYRRVICQSGVSSYHSGIWKRINGGKYLRSILKKIYGFTPENSRDIIHFLKSKSAEELARLLAVPFQPVVDGYFVRELPGTTFQKHQQDPVELILGFNSDEGTRFVMHAFEDLPVVSLSDARKYVKDYIINVAFRNSKAVDAITDLVMHEYGATNESNREQLTQISSNIYADWVFTTATVDIATKHSDSASTYMYYFDHRPGHTSWPAWTRADHSDEIQYVLGLPFFPDVSVVYSKEEEQLSRIMMQCWANFAHTGNPNGPGLPEWPKSDRKDKSYIVFDKNPRQQRNYCPEKCKLWNETLPAMVKSRQVTSKY